MKFKLKAKKLWLILPIMVVLSLVAAACGSDGDDDSASTDAAPAEDPTGAGLVFDIGGRGDGTFNDAAARGLDRAEDELGARVSTVSPNEDGTNRVELLELQASRNDIVIGVGFLFGDSIAEVAGTTPDTNFAIVDSPSSADNPNLLGLLFAADEGSCMVGVAAALKTETQKVGFIGGVDVPLIQEFQRGYEVCVNDVDSDIEVMTEYISPAGDFSGFGDPAKAKIIAAKMYEEGADIVYHAAGGSGGGLFEAAIEHSRASGNSKVWAIGVDSDQYNTVNDEDLREFILTSMLKRVDVAVFNTIQSQQDGTFVGGQNKIHDLSVDGVGYSSSGGFVDDIKDELEAYKQRVIDGEFNSQFDA